MNDSTDSPLNISKSCTITRSNVGDYCQRLLTSAQYTQVEIAKRLADPSISPIKFLSQLKFDQVGCDPLDASRPLNLIEQLNQTFTYIASFYAAQFIFERHPKVQSLLLNLGTSAGFDIETSEDGGIAAEVFAAVTPQNNQKLNKDVAKVAVADAMYRYVFFMSPEHEVGLYKGKIKDSRVIVWSLGCVSLNDL